VERELLNKLKQRGYKLTPQRRAVLKTFARSWHHLTPAEIYEKVRREYPSIGLVTVYRTLEILVELGLICEVNPEGSSRSYLTKRESGHHHHLVCSGCGAVVEFTTYALNELEQRLSRDFGFRIKDHLLEFKGLCPACQKIPQT
jgi:Fur family ferric uptake transcriptional regulator